jgi:hypothetical protein
MAKSFKDLQAYAPSLKPFEVAITGLDEPILIHAFTVTELDKTAAAMEGMDDTTAFRTQVVLLLNGSDHEVTDKDREDVARIFSLWQLREIFNKGLKLNGQGPEALREAEKN